MRTIPAFPSVVQGLLRPALGCFAFHLLAAVLAAQCTNPTQVPNQTISSGTTSYTDNNALKATQVTVNGSASVAFVAGSCIELGPGFRATAGTAPTTFHAWVETAPSVISVSPASGSGLSQPFTWTVSSPSGHSNVADLLAVFNTSLTGTFGCYVWYNRASNLLSVADNSGANWSPGIAPDSSGTTGDFNPNCTVNGTGSSFKGTGTQLEVTASVTFQSTFAGTKNQYLVAYDNEGLNTVWQQYGTWTVPEPYPVTFQSSPSGRALKVDSTACTTPCTLQLIPGTHTVDAALTQSAPGAQFAFQSWSDGGAASHTISTTAAASTYTVTFTSQYLVSTAATPSAAGSITLSPPGGWYASGTPVTADISGNSGWAFSGFSGALIGGIAPRSFTVTAPAAITANFIPDFTLTAGSPGPTTVSATVSFTLTVASQNGFADTVTFDAPTMPTGATASFSPTSVTGAGITTVTLSGGASAGNFAVTMRATAASGLSHAAGITLAVQDFSLTPVTASAAATPGNGVSTHFQWAVNRINAFTGAVGVNQVRIIADPQNPDPTSQASIQLSNQCPLTNWNSSANTDSVTLYLVPAAGCNTGSNGYTYNLLVYFGSQGVTHTALGTLHVSSLSNFSVTADPVNAIAAPGSVVTYTLKVAGTGTFTGAVDFSVPPLPCGYLTSPPSNQVPSGASTTLQWNTTGCSPGNIYPISISGFNMNSNRVNYVYPSLTIGSAAQPDFSISTSGGNVTVTPGGGDVYTLNVTPVNGFNAAVSFAAGTLPGGVSVSFPAGNTVTGSGTLQVRVNTTAAAAVAAQTLAITGAATSLGISRSTMLSLQVVAPRPDFSLNDLSPVTIPAGGSVAVPITVNQLNNRTGTVTLRSASALPPGIKVSFSGNTMILSADGTVPAGDYALLVEGDGGNGIIHRGGGSGRGGGAILYIVAPHIDRVSSPDGQQDPATLISGRPSHITITGSHFGMDEGVLNFWQAGKLPGDSAGWFPPDGHGWQSYRVDRWEENKIEVTLTPDPLAATANWEVWAFPRTNGGTLTDHDASYPSMGYMRLYDATPEITGLDVSATFSPGNPVTLFIKGPSFGSAPGTVRVCAIATSTDPCAQSPEISVGPVIWGGVISVIITPSLTASGPYCVQVTRTGVNGTPFSPAPNGGSIATGNCFGLETASVTLSPGDVSGDPGEVFPITASGSAPSGVGSYSWSLSGENASAFRFVSASCTSGSSCPAVLPNSCSGAVSCTVYVQATSAGFANIGVVFQTQSASSPQRSARLRAITVLITKIWSDQFPGGVVANYLPADGDSPSCGSGDRPTPPACTGAGAGLVGNARQLLTVATRPGIPTPGDPKGELPGLHGYLKADVRTVPVGPEALDHILVRVAPGVPVITSQASTPPNTAPQGRRGRNGTVFSIEVPEPLTVADYTVVAGVNRRGQNQAEDNLTTQQVSSWFSIGCSNIPLPGFAPCSNGAVRVVAQNEFTEFQALAWGGAVWNTGAYPTAGRFLRAFVANVPPADASVDPVSTPGVCDGRVATLPSTPCIDTSQLYFNDGVIFGPPTHSLYVGPVDVHEFSRDSNVATRIWRDADFKELIGETLQAHKQDVIDYFNNNPSSSSYVSPPWQAIGCHSIPGANCNSLPYPDTTKFATDARSRVDKPPLFPCAVSPGALPPGMTAAALAFPSVECDLTFDADTNLRYAFGRVGYSLTVEARVSAANPGVVTSVSLSGHIYDIYQWNPVMGSEDFHLANIQGGFNTLSSLLLGQGGHVYKTKVNLDTGTLFNADETQYTYTFR